VLAAIALILITAYYMAVNPAPLLSGIQSLFPPTRREWARAVMARLRSSWVGWMQGVLVDMAITGVLVYIGLELVGLELTIFFAVFSAILVIVPYFGAILGAIPPTLFALADGTDTALLTLGVYVLIQQIEGNLTIPLVMANRVRLHPALVAIGVVVVGQLFGFIGLFVAVPILAAIVIAVDELWAAGCGRERDRARPRLSDASVVVSELAREGRREPEPGHGQREGPGDDRDQGAAVDDAGDQHQHSGHRPGEEDDAGDRQPVGAVDDPLLVELAKPHPMARGRRDQADGGGGDQQQGDEVDGLLEVGDRRPALLEGKNQQEREQHLDPGEHHPELLQQLHQVAVEALLLGLVAALGVLGARVRASVGVVHSFLTYRPRPPQNRPMVRSIASTAWARSRPGW
jgi:hypothetical protein